MVHYPKTAWQGAPDRHSTTAKVRVPSAGSARAGVSVHETIVDFLEAADRGSALDRYGRAFSADSIRELRWCLSGHVDEQLGSVDVREVHRRDLEALVDELAAAGLTRRRLRAVAKSLRALYDYAGERELVTHNPAARIALPDEDDAEQPSRGRPQPSRLRSVAVGADRAWVGADRALSLGLQVATLCFVLLALFFIAESL
jgi:hypothetical protein